MCHSRHYHYQVSIFGGLKGSTFIVHVCNGIPLSNKREQNNSITSDMGKLQKKVK